MNHEIDKDLLVRNVLIFTFILGILLATGCTSSRMAAGMADALSGDEVSVFATDEDPVLVGQALPFALKMYESLLQESPDHVPLLLATGKAFTLYAYGYVQTPAEHLPTDADGKRGEELERAKNLYFRARGYLFDALEQQHPGFRTSLAKGATDSLLASMTQTDTALLYWTGMSWMGAFSTAKSNLSLLMGVRKAAAMIMRVGELNPSFGRGSVDEFLISYYGNLPKSMGGSLEKAQEHFEKALQHSQGTKAGPFVTMATTVAAKSKDKPHFEKLLRKALDVDLDSYPPDRLVNALAQRNARWLLENSDRFFGTE